MVRRQPVCGLPNARQITTPRHTPGSFRVTIPGDSRPLWEFVAIRPSASSGTRGSGIELRDVHYRGRPVLARAHAPILNVNYDGDACGPFRDWVWQESAFTAEGTDVAPGFRRCSAPPRTIIESGSDQGNFRGVAIWADGLDTLLVSELQAGFYRFVSQWRFSPDGTIRPRFGFSSVAHRCVCLRHHHHVYWRFHFNLDTAGSNQVLELNRGAAARVLPVETMRLRHPPTRRRWLVRDRLTRAGYLVAPGLGDGTANAYGQGDVWVLRHHPDEIDDGHNSTTRATAADLNGFLTAEPVDGAELVVWYAGHFTHDNNEGTPDAVLGPDLLPNAAFLRSGRIQVHSVD